MRGSGSRLAFLLLVPAMPAFAAGAEAKVKLPTSRADLLAGKKLFEVQCALCHGPKGEGARGPILDAGQAVARARRRGAAQSPGRWHSRYGDAGGRSDVRPRDAANRGVCPVARQGDAETRAGGCGARRRDLHAARATARAATPSMATVASRGRIYPQSAIRAAPRIFANRSSIRTPPYPRGTCW